MRTNARANERIILSLDEVPNFTVLRLISLTGFWAWFCYLEGEEFKRIEALTQDYPQNPDTEYTSANGATCHSGPRRLRYGVMARNAWDISGVASSLKRFTCV